MKLHGMVLSAAVALGVAWGAAGPAHGQAASDVVGGVVSTAQGQADADAAAGVLSVAQAQAAGAVTGVLSVAQAQAENEDAAALAAGGGAAGGMLAATGVVYHDRNGNGVRDSGEDGISGVGVSNGRDVVETDRRGRWTLPVLRRGEGASAGFMTELATSQVLGDESVRTSGRSGGVSASGVGAAAQAGGSDGAGGGSRGRSPSRGASDLAADVVGAELGPDDTTFFVIQPAGWRAPVNAQNLPRFYYVHKPEGSPEGKFAGVPPTGPLPASVDFPLVRTETRNRFEVIFFGDPQPRNEQEVHYIAHDVVEELHGSNAAFGVTLGDIVFNDLAVFDPLNAVVGTIGVPWYNVIGNHDLNMDVPTDDLSDETYERIYGPPYYAFDYGKVHFVVLDDVMWDGDGYHGEIGAKQLEFVQNDLARVPDDRLVVYLMHVPLVNVRDKADFFAVIGEREKTFSISAHWHRQGNYSFGQEDGWHGVGEHRHLVHGTVSGSWWSGVKDEWGIPHTMMSDGTPNGYSIGMFNGTDFLIRYKAARRPDDFQMSVHAPDVIWQAAVGQTEVLANVFMGSNNDVVEMRVGDDGAWRPMTREERPDAFYEALKEREPYQTAILGRTLPETRNSTHLWVATLPADTPVGTYVLQVRAKDWFGQEHTGRRIVHVR